MLATFDLVNDLQNEKKILCFLNKFEIDTHSMITLQTNMITAEKINIDNYRNYLLFEP